MYCIVSITVSSNIKIQMNANYIAQYSFGGGKDGGLLSVFLFLPFLHNITPFVIFILLRYPAVKLICNA